MEKEKKLKKFWKNKKVFVTGHTGFKGAWLTVFLNMLGAKIYGYSLPEKKNSFFSRIKNKNILKKNFYSNICNLNSSMLRLVQLSRIFMSRPDIAILDQPTRDLDPDNKITFWKNLKTVLKGSTIIYSSYDFDEIQGLPFLDSASVYLTGNNLLLITGYKWGDPEVSDGGSSTVAQGVADDQYPYASSVAIGFRLNL